MTSANEARDHALYKYPDSDTLRNKFDIRDADALADAEAEFARQRIEQGVPPGNFDLKHLQDIHRHIFQDVYEWAGELRQVDFHKTDWFLPHGRIQMGMGNVHARLVKQDYLKGLSQKSLQQKPGKLSVTSITFTLFEKATAVPSSNISNNLARALATALILRVSSAKVGSMRRSQVLGAAKLNCLDVF